MVKEIGRQLKALETSSWLRFSGETEEQTTMVFKDLLRGSDGCQGRQRQCELATVATCFVAQCVHLKIIISHPILESVQDFLIKLEMKRCVHLMEISILSLNLVIVRLNKIMNRADKNWAHFQKTKYFKNQSFQKISFLKIDLIV